MKVAVLYGGTSAEREVSLSSGKAIIKACEELGHDVSDLDLVDHIEPFIEELTRADVVFNGLHGGEGENGVIPGFLQSLGITYTGSGNEASAICMDKRVSKSLVHRKNIPTPNWMSLTEDEAIQNMDHLNFPLVVKPNDQGSTIGLTVLQDESGLDEAVSLAREYARIVLMEEFIAGREITVTVIGEKAYPIVEIVPSHDLYDYECKYTKGMSHYYCPADIPEKDSIQIMDMALTIHKLLGCRHYSRVDFRLDKNNKPWFLEVNTLPGMTETSLVPKAAKAGGLSFSKLIQTILNEALKQ